MNKTKTWFYSPYHIAALIIGLLLLFIPWNIPKYKILERQTFCEAHPTEYCFEGKDMNADQIGEVVKFKINHADSAAMVIYHKDAKAIDQWNFKGVFERKWDFYTFFDADQNGFQEVYLITSANDSVFLNILEPLNYKNQNIRCRFICTLPEKTRLKDLTIKLYTPEKILNENTNSLIFVINNGFNVDPRSLFLYQVESNELKEFSFKKTTLYYTWSRDINHDGVKELFLATSSPGNLDSLESDYPYDSYIRTLYIDPSSNKPVKCLLERLALYNQMCTDADTKTNTIFALTIYPGNKYPTLYRWSLKGEFIDSMFIGTRKLKGSEKIHLNKDDIEKKFFLANEKGESYTVLPNGEIKKWNRKGTQMGSLLHADLNKDGKDEKVYISGKCKVIIFPPNYKHAASIELEHTNEASMYTKASKLIGPEQDYLMIHHAGMVRLYSYDNNYWYYVPIPGAILAYLLIVLGIYLVKKQEASKWQKQKQKEVQLQKLQFQSISNQISPHFSFNIMNTMGYHILSNKPEEATHILTKYTALMRELVENGLNILIPLEKEIAFIRNYLDLQKIRFENELSYEIIVHDNVSSDRVIPRMVLFTFVENAIKHGLFPKKTDCTLKIQIKTGHDKLFVLIEDNGIGRKRAATETKSTGKGLVILEQIITTYKELYQKRIKYSYTDINNKKTGTRVNLIIE